MVSTLRAAAKFFDQRVGWSWVGFVLSVTILAVAAFVLFHMVRDIDLDDVLDAIEAIPRRSIVLSGAFVAAGYVTLTLYDLFALRTIGRRDVPYRVAALAGFTSYSVGHNLGASVFTGGAVRYRIYSAYGLDAVDVAKICFLAGLTFWLGNATMLGVGVLYVPQAATAIDQLPPFVNRGLAVVILLLLAAYIGWVWRRPRIIGRSQWRVALPNGPSTLLQIGIGMIDLSCCAMAMYTLVPTEPNIGLATVSVIFVSATLLGFASHAPGGLGVFDAAMLIALWEFDKEDLLAGLLLFRLLYYIVPFAITLVILGVRETIISVSGARARALPGKVPALDQPSACTDGGKTEARLPGTDGS